MKAGFTPPLTLLAAFLLFATGAGAQSLSLTLLADLPAEIQESSGLELAAGGAYWTHNDSGSEPLLYRINAAGAITRTLRVTNALNRDWEDLTRGPDGALYIGDFGNNDNLRTDLRVYRIPDPDTWPSDSVEAQVIEFHYPEQTAFPPPATQRHYDAEAMVYLGGRLLIFTKNRTEPFSGISRIYSLPVAAGNWPAVLVDSFQTGASSMLQGWVGAAALSPDGERLALLGYDRLWLFTCANGRPFTRGVVQTLSFGPGLTQKEGLVFEDNQTLAITDENLFGFLPGRLYRSDLSAFLPSDCCPAPEGLSASASGSGYLLSWHAVPGADAYRLQAQVEGGPGLARLSTDTALWIPGPPAAAQARVQARCGDQISERSAPIPFGTAIRNLVWRRPGARLRSGGL